MDCRDQERLTAFGGISPEVRERAIAKKQVDKAETEATTLRRLVEAQEAAARVRTKGGAAEPVVAPLELPAKRQRRLDYDSFD